MTISPSRSVIDRVLSVSTVETIAGLTGPLWPGRGHRLDWRAEVREL